MMSLQSPGSVGIGAASPATVSSRQCTGSRARRARTRVRFVPDSLADFLQLSCDRREGQFWIHRRLPFYRASWKLAALEGHLSM